MVTAVSNEATGRCTADVLTINQLGWYLIFLQDITILWKVNNIDGTFIQNKYISYSVEFPTVIGCAWKCLGFLVELGLPLVRMLYN